jgi:uncharacterized damage-inducible protein DinB
MLPEALPFRSRAVRALVLLHDRELRRFFSAWRDAEWAGVALPPPHVGPYASPAALLRHVLGAARGYMVWMTQQLDLPDPGIEPAPEVEDMGERAEAYLEHVLGRWRAPLRDVGDELLEDRPHPIWGVTYTIDAMLEHAVMHPIRHTFQLEELVQRAGSEGGRA